MPGKEVGGPLPHVAGHIEQAIAVRRVGLDRRGPLVAVEHQVLPRELALPGVGHHLAARRELIAPAEGLAVQATTGRVLPLSLGRQLLAGPRGVRFGVPVGHVGHRVALSSVQCAVRALGMTPLSAGRPAPPVPHVTQVDRPGGLMKDQRSRDQHLGIGAGVISRIGSLLSPGDVTGGLHKAAELGDRHRMLVDPEPVHRDAMHRAFLGIKVVRAHGELARRDPDHVLGRSQPGPARRRGGPLRSRRRCLA